jgi:hypothetical protein
MQRRPDRQNESWDQERSTSARLAALHGAREKSQATGKHRPISTPTGEYRAIPKRPPGMPQHLDAPPEIAERAPRPQRPQTQPKKMRPLIIVLGGIVAIFAIIITAFIILFITGINQASGPTKTATDFVSSLATRNYEQAYRDLAPQPTIGPKPTLQDFTLQATRLDDAEGKITDYHEDPNSAKMINDNTESLTYTITREKLTYKLTITLKQQDPNDNNSWKIVSYARPQQGPGL